MKQTQSKDRRDFITMMTSLVALFVATGATTKAATTSGNLTPQAIAMLESLSDTDLQCIISLASSLAPGRRGHRPERDGYQPLPEEWFPPSRRPHVRVDNARWSKYYADKKIDPNTPLPPYEEWS